MSRSQHTLGRPDVRTRGFSLIELMVAMAIGLFLVATIGYVFLGAKASHNNLDALSRIQENARFAFEYMGKDIRLAGFTGGTHFGNQAQNRLNAGAIAFDPNLVDLYGPNKSPRTTQPGPQDPQGPLFGYDDGDTGLPTFSTPRLRGDILTVAHADTDYEYSLTALPASPNLTIACPPSGTPLPKDGQVVVLSDYTNSTVFQITGGEVSTCSGTITLSYAVSGAIPGNASSDLGTFSGGYLVTKLFRLRGASYYIASNPAGEPSLYRLELGHSGTTANATAQEIVEGVKDMQIEYGEDAEVESPTDAKSVTAYRTAQAVEDWKKVYSVRITLTLVSGQGTNVATTGGQLEKTIANTVAVRNRLQ